MNYRLICRNAEPYTQTHTSLQEETGLSKAAVTNGLHYLEALGVIQFRMADDSRRRSICLQPVKLANYLKRRMAAFHYLGGLLDEVAAQHKDPDYQKEILAVAYLCDELDEQVNAIIDVWEAEHGEQ